MSREAAPVAGDRTPYSRTHDNIWRATTMPPLRAAIIGCGRMGSTIDDELPRYSSNTSPFSHAARYAAVPDTVLVAACDPVPEKLRIFGERWGITALYADAAEMMRQEQPDLVSICTNTGIRHEVAMTVMEYGPKAIFLEKPMAETLRQCDDMIAACEARGIVTAVNCSRRWEPCFTRAKDLMRDIVGAPRSVVAYCGGGLSHMGSHLLDLVRYLVDDLPAEWVMGHIPDAEAARGEQDVSGLGLIKFAGPVTAYVNMVDAGVTGVEVDLVCERGRIHLGDNGWVRKLYLPASEGLGYRHLAEIPFPDDAHHPDFGRASVMDLARCVREGGKPRCSAMDGRAALELALALRASERQGGTRVHLPYPELDDPIRSV
jgi:predicted dehydrogenase